MKNLSKIEQALFGVLLILCTSAAQADDLLDRLEVATEQYGRNQGAFYVSRAPELKDKMPPWEWDEEIRTASGCVLDGIENAKGRAVAEAYVTGIEKDSKVEITSIAQLGDESSLPAELRGDDKTLLNLLESCGTLDVSAVRLKESGFWDAMMDPKIQEKLLAD